MTKTSGFFFAMFFQKRNPRSFPLGLGVACLTLALGAGC